MAGVEIEAGGIVFFPERVERGIRNPEENRADLVLVDQISPPQFDLYEPAGYYDREHGVMNLEAKKQAKSDDLSGGNKMHLNESHPEVRAWNLTAEETGGSYLRFFFLRSGFGWPPVSCWPLESCWTTEFG